MKFNQSKQIINVIRLVRKEKLQIKTKVFE